LTIEEDPLILISGRFLVMNLSMISEVTVCAPNLSGLLLVSFSVKNLEGVNFREIGTGMKYGSRWGSNILG